MSSDWITHPTIPSETVITWDKGECIGTKVVIEYYLNPKTQQSFKVVRTIRLKKEIVKISKSILQRQTWTNAKFGKCKDVLPGLEPGVTFVQLAQVTIEKNEEENLTKTKEKILPSQEKYKPKCNIETKGRCSNITSDITLETTTQIMISNLPEETTFDDVRRICRGFGYIDRIHVPKDYTTGDTRGFAFVTFSNRDSAEKAKKALNARGYGNMILQVIYSIDKKKQELTQEKQEFKTNSKPDANMKHKTTYFAPFKQSGKVRNHVREEDRALS